MLKGNLESRAGWLLLPNELAVWMVLLTALGFCALAGQGGGSGLADVRVQRVEVQGARAGEITSVPQEKTWRLDLNSATQAELELLPDLGRHRAEAILKERDRRGAFQNVWELTEVPGLTPALVRRLEPLLRVAQVPK